MEEHTVCGLVGVIYACICLSDIDIYLAAIGLRPGGSTTRHIYKQTIHKTHSEGKLGSAGRVPSCWVIPWHLPYNWGKSTEKTSVRVAQYQNNEQRHYKCHEQKHPTRHEPAQYKNNEQAPEQWHSIPSLTRISQQQQRTQNTQLTKLPTPGMYTMCQLILN